MARNAEKAMTTLARWRAAQVSDTGKERERRPYLASECHDLPKAEKWRMQIIREIAKKVAQIQNAGLGEFRIRDLNDEINKLLREKGHWETQIRELGGPDYAKVGPRMLDHEGKEVPGNRGYKYFGAAKDLPGVRELFEQEPPPPPRKTRAELMKDIDADYYGYRDDDDGILTPLEQNEERRAIAKAVMEWKERKEAALHGETDPGYQEEEEENIYAVAPDPDKHVYSSDGHQRTVSISVTLQTLTQSAQLKMPMTDRRKHVSEENQSDEDEKPASEESLQPRFIAHVPVPSQKEIEEALLRRKKQELLEKYASESLITESEEAKDLLGVNN